MALCHGKRTVALSGDWLPLGIASGNGALTIRYGTFLRTASNLQTVLMVGPHWIADSAFRAVVARSERSRR